MVAHVCNPSNLSGRDRMIEVRGQPEQNLVRYYLKNKPGMVTQAYNLSYLGGRGRTTTV
jgi:hypothetical protein